MLTIKVAILIGAAYFIYDKLTNNSQLNVDTLWAQIKVSQLLHASNISVLIFISILNWFVEIVKWQTLVRSFKEISLWESAAHTLGGLTASLFTPNRIGEYGAKALYFQKSERKRVVGLNFLGNFAQLLATIFFGVLGGLFFMIHFELTLPWTKLWQIVLLLMIIAILLIVITKQKVIQIKGFSWGRIRDFLGNVSGEIHTKNSIYAVLRYLIFSHQFYFLLLFFGLHTSYFLTMSTISVMYLITSLIPMLFIFDVVVKGSVAVWLFGYLDLPQLSILTVVSLMWIFNFVLPSIAGSYFVLRFSMPATNEKSVIS